MRNNTITVICLAIISCAFLACLICVFIFSKDTVAKKRRIIDSFPNIISTLGVIGTFLGITLGLVDFDTSNIDAGIESLLKGLKTAFYTSLMGMSGSLILRWIIDKRFDKEEEGITSTEAASREICKQIQQMSVQMVDAVNRSNISTQTLLQELQSIKSNQVTFFNSVQNQLDIIASDNLETIKTNFDTLTLCVRNISQTVDIINNNVGNISALTSSINVVVGETRDIETLNASVSKEQLGKTETLCAVLHSEAEAIERKMSETNTMLSNKFDEFSVLLEKSNTEALVEVMKKVTEEFQKQMNDLISRLVKENFDQLNKSVERLNLWQQENKEMIVALTSQYKQMSNEFSNTSQHLSNVTNDTQKLVGNGSLLSKLVAQLSKVMIEDDKYVQIASKLENAITNTKDSILKLDESTTKQLEWIRRNNEIVDEIKVLVAKLQELNKIRDYSEEFWADTKQNMNEGVGIIKSGIKDLNEQLSEIDQHFYERLGATLGELDACIQAMVNGRRTY